MKKIDLSQNVPFVWKRLKKTETRSGKGENTRLHFFWKHQNNGLYREIIETD